MKIKNDYLERKTKNTTESVTMTIKRNLNLPSMESVNSITMMSPWKSLFTMPTSLSSLPSTPLMSSSPLKSLPKSVPHVNVNISAKRQNTFIINLFQLINHNFIIIFLIINLMVTNNVQCFCPSKCNCDNEQYLRASCVNAGLEIVPIQFNPEVKFINLSINSIPDIHYTLTFYSHLEILDLSQNRITTLGSRNFESQQGLRTLNMSRNLIGNLGRDAFLGLRNLLVLDISYNRIETIHQSALQDLRNLIVIDMSYNNLVSMEIGVFESLRSIQTLLLKSNQLLEIPTDNLKYLSDLNILDLSDNLIETIRNDSINGLKDLTTLHLNGNVIMELDLRAFDGLSSLKNLNLGDNNLTTVPTQQLSKLSNLSYLSLSGNNIEVIPPVALLNLFQLNELHLDRLDKLHKIDSRAFVDNTLLQIVTLDYNQRFSDLPSKLFHGNPNLIEISLRENGITTLDAAQFPLDQLHRLQLGNNPLQCNCSLQWLWILTTDYEQHLRSAVVDLKVLPHSMDSMDKGSVTKKPSISNGVTVLIVDSNEIGCEIGHGTAKQTRYLLKDMSESSIKCPSHMITILCAIITVIVVILLGASIFYYVKVIKRRKMNDVAAVVKRKNVMDHIVVPQQVDKFELERYLASQTLANEYRALRPWECQIKQPPPEEPDHYENFDDFQFNDKSYNVKPHVVYV